MSPLRQIAVKENDNKIRKAVVYFDPDTKDYMINFYINGQCQSHADYYTEDKQEALDTADYWVNEVTN